MARQPATVPSVGKSATIAALEKPIMQKQAHLHD
jgi:hypothetical protein